ncbi:hypothetical protein BC008_13670 [Mastigocoleus testarum BC008]|uniref:Uncharacterized protein n=1 Tax=Mastigocoleus testarum BC008 TaxID=371196 RepID=A0A0V7ZG43_9CYAN|nr:hypothetical protein BC008_13670 [Mastigocoleus testarum BC008]
MESSNFYVISDIRFDDHEINMNYLDFNGEFTPDSLESQKFKTKEDAEKFLKYFDLDSESVQVIFVR